MIQFEKAHIGYADVIVTVSSLELQSGKLYILVGKNGAGKSTLLKTITKQVPLLNGTIELNGISIDQLKASDIGKHMAFVRSTFPEIDYIKVQEFIALGRSPHTDAFGRLKAKDLESVEKAISALEIDHLRNKFTRELSDGERQMVGIARALSQETPIILLDEPTAFLDYGNKLNVLNRLKEIAQTMNKCILLSSHDIDLSTEANCPFVVLPFQGNEIQLVEKTSKKELLNLAFGI